VQVDTILGALEYATADPLTLPDVNVRDVGKLRQHIALLRRQAVKAGNQRKALKAINRAQRMIRLELQWLWGLMKNAGANPPTPTTEFSNLFERSKATLWDQFRQEIRHSNSAQEQVDKLAKFILAEVPGEPSRDEGAVDTAIRWIRMQQKVGEELVAENIGHSGTVVKALLDQHREVINKLKRGSCWCEMAIGNPMVKNHSQGCQQAQALMGGG
jgi:hypothetical protein